MMQTAKIEKEKGGETTGDTANGESTEKTRSRSAGAAAEAFFGAKRDPFTGFDKGYRPAQKTLAAEAPAESVSELCVALREIAKDTKVLRRFCTEEDRMIARVSEIQERIIGIQPSKDELSKLAAALGALVRSDELVSKLKDPTIGILHPEDCDMELLRELCGLRGHFEESVLEESSYLPRLLLNRLHDRSVYMERRCQEWAKRILGELGMPSKEVKKVVSTIRLETPPPETIEQEDTAEVTDSLGDDLDEQAISEAS